MFQWLIAKHHAALQWLALGVAVLALLTRLSILAGAPTWLAYFVLAATPVVVVNHLAILLGAFDSIGAQAGSGGLGTGLEFLKRLYGSPPPAVKYGLTPSLFVLTAVDFGFAIIQLRSGSFARGQFLTLAATFVAVTSSNHWVALKFIIPTLGHRDQSEADSSQAKTWNESTDYRPHWSAARRRWALFIVVWLGWLPVGGLGAWLTDAPNPPGWFALLWGIPFFWTGYRAVNLKCPRCGKHFTRKGLYGNAFASSCLNCGLPRGEPHSPSQGDS